MVNKKKKLASKKSGTEIQATNSKKVPKNKETKLPAKSAEQPAHKNAHKSAGKSTKQIKPATRLLEALKATGSTKNVPNDENVSENTQKKSSLGTGLAKTSSVLSPPSPILSSSSQMQAHKPQVELVSLKDSVASKSLKQNNAPVSLAAQASLPSSNEVKLNKNFLEKTPTFNKVPTEQSATTTSKKSTPKRSKLKHNEVSFASCSKIHESSGSVAINSKKNQIKVELCLPKTELSGAKPAKKWPKHKNNSLYTSAPNPTDAQKPTTNKSLNHSTNVPKLAPKVLNPTEAQKQITNKSLNHTINTPKLAPKAFNLINKVLNETKKQNQKKSPQAQKSLLEKAKEPIVEYTNREPKPVYENIDKMTSREFQKDPYASIEITSQYVKDRELMDHFKAAIVHNKHLFKGRTVLDIGCGLGMLSMFAAKAGAAHVYAVDCSNVIDYTKRIVTDNGYADIIHVIKGRIQDVELPVQQVDIIVSDWIGYSVLFESICDAVIFARNKWLKPGGLIFPDKVQLFLAGVQDSKAKSNKVEWWNFVYEFKMHCLRDWAVREPAFKRVLQSQVLTTAYSIMLLDLNQATYDDLKFRAKFRLSIARSGCMDGICTYFTVLFTKSHTPLWLSTGPGAAGTRWNQMVCFFDSYLPVNTGEMYYGGIEMRSTAAAAATPDLNDMIIRFELYGGEPALNEMELKREMVWQLKPRHNVVNENIKLNAA